VRGPKKRKKKSREQGCKQHDSWGDPLGDRPADHSRIAFCSIWGLPVDPNHHKHRQLHHSMRRHQLNVFGIIEVNLNFKVLGTKAQWADRFAHARNYHTSVAWNKHNNGTRRRNFGGVVNIADPDLSHRVISAGHDPSDLDRWTWTLFRGQHGIRVRMITGYRPCMDYSDKPGSVYSQHEYYLNKKKDSRDPRLAFYEDLDLDVRVWLAAGDLIIIGLDANENVRQGTTAQYMDKWGLKDVHECTHPHLSPVATQNTNHNNIPVDVLWCSPGLPITAAGMTGFGALSIDSVDHRMLWVDIPHEFLFGFNPPPSLPQVTPNRLNLRNPKVTARYNRLQKKEKQRHNVPETILYVLDQATKGLFNAETAAQQDTLAQRHAQANCRPIYMGQVPFSDVIGLAHDEIHLWKSMVRKRQGLSISPKLLRRLTKNSTGAMPTA
jgi:hypothetical protein